MSVFIGYPSFMAYQMMKGKKGNNDGFPSITGMIARYSALGLTNEQMAANPVWVDKTSNGHDIQLKNLAWGGMSGVGGYVENYNRWTKSAVRADITFTDHSFNVTSVKINQAQFYYQSSGGEQPFTVPSGTVIVKGLTDGQVLEYIYTDIEGSGYNEEGEYAGYLVTDGVDDKITSSIFEMGNDWTVIGDWELINTGKKDNAGIVKFDSIVIYNYNSILINIKNGRNNLIPDQNTVNAICSDGRIYSKDWKESIYNEETESTSKNFLTIGYSGNAYTKIAFKNLAIYPTVLSKDDCIKAYNYLQTLKAK